MNTELLNIQDHCGNSASRSRYEPGAAIVDSTRIDDLIELVKLLVSVKSHYFKIRGIP